MILDCYKPTFARRFDGTDDYLEHAAAIVSTTPLTMACWFNSTTITATQTLLFVGDNASTISYQSLNIAGATAGDPVQAFTKVAATNSNAVSSNGYIANRWHHACGVFAANNDRRAFIDGGSKGTEGTARNPPNAFNTTAIGRLSTSSPGQEMSGLIAWPAIWNIALSDAEIARLGSGAHPRTVRPESLVAFWDFDGRDTEFGLRATYPLTNNGSVPVNGPGFLRTRIPRPWLLGAGAQASSGNRRRRVLLTGAR